MAEPSYIYEGTCHSCSTRVLISQRATGLHEALNVPRPEASSGRGVCPVCAKKITWKKYAMAVRKGD